MAGHSRVQSSFRFAVRNVRPLARVSSVKSSDQRWLAAFGTGVVVPQRGILKLASAAADADRPAQQLAQPKREDAVASRWLNSRRSQGPPR